jgi:hypothetical protein
VTFATKRPAARPFSPGAALLLRPVLTSSVAGRAQGTAETYANPSTLEAKGGYWHPRGTGESPRGREGSTRVNPTVPALQI